MNQTIINDINKRKLMSFSTIKREYWLIIIGALIFTASFLWKDLLTDFEEHLFPKGSGLLGRTLYVLVVTFIIVMISVHLKTKLGLTSTNVGRLFDDGTLGDSDRHLPGTSSDTSDSSDSSSSTD